MSLNTIHYLAANTELCFNLRFFNILASALCFMKYTLSTFSQLFCILYSMDLNLNFKFNS